MEPRTRQAVGRRSKIALAIIAIAFLALYARTANFGYVWDDVRGIKNNPIMTGPLLPGLLATQLDHIDPNIRQLTGVESAHDSYRPLLFLSYRIDVALAGTSARVMHAHNVLLGLLVAFVFFMLARRWLGSDTPALTATAIFALHPVQVETVAYISGRGDLLAGLFALLSTLCAFIAIDKRTDNDKRVWLWIVLGCVAYLASLLSKESYLGLPIAIAEILFARHRLRRNFLIPTIMTAVLGVYLTVRTVIAGAGTGSGVAQALAAFPGVCLHYLQICLLPTDLSSERLYVSGFLLWGWVMVGVLVGLAAWLFRRGKPSTAPLLVALSGLLWMFVLIGPSTLIVLMHKTVADRYMYAPLAGFAIACASSLHAAIAARPTLRTPLIAGMGVWAVLLLVIGWTQVKVWRSNRSLYAHAVAMAPKSSMAFYRLGFSYAVENDCATATPLFQEAIALDADNSRALNNLGFCYMRTGQLAEAEEVLVRALKVSDGTYFRGWYNLGATRIALGKRQDGCRDLATAIRINANYAAARSLFARSCPSEPD